MILIVFSEFDRILIIFFHSQKSLFMKGSDFVEKEFRQLLSRHSDPVPPVLILDLVNEDENTPDSDKMILEQLPGNFFLTNFT